MKTYGEQAYALTRISIPALFLWFGVNQLLFPGEFIGYLPEMILNSESAYSFVYINGFMEIMLGTMLALGLFTRIIALIMSVKLSAIALNLGYNDLAVRDFGLALVTLSIFIGGVDRWTLDYRKKQHT